MEIEPNHERSLPQGRPYLTDPELTEVWERLLQLDDWVLERQQELTGIPAPPFEEGPRGERMAELFREVGLADIQRDEVGNILARPAGSPKEDTPLILSAHLDTVFPPGTEVTPRWSDGVIHAPGIADDGRGLAALLALARLVEEVTLPPLPPLLFVATVGEEGAGDLRGVRHLFRREGPGSTARGFISLDGVGLNRIINQGVGSTRLRATLRGPGGHSWTDWGLPNPIHALGKVTAAVETLPLPSQPRTTATVARCGGGKSINAIPQEAWIEVDLRSRGPRELKVLEEAFLTSCRRVAQGGSGSSTSSLTLEIHELGRRPAGDTPAKEPLVRAALSATRALGVEPKLSASSTDANIPMSLGIPAITLGAGGKAGGIHTLNEWYANEEGPEGILRALLTVLKVGSMGDHPTSE
jgi:acetylornithine deacetylase/succinyl-diaminopimelate desuccinylase-like protein